MDKKKKEKVHVSKDHIKKKLSNSPIQMTEEEADAFLRSIKAVPEEDEIESFLRTIKAVPSEGEIDQFLRSIKAQGDDGKPMLYADGDPVSYDRTAPSSPFAQETMAQLRRTGSLVDSMDQIDVSFFPFFFSFPRPLSLPRVFSLTPSSFPLYE